MSTCIDSFKFSCDRKLKSSFNSHKIGTQIVYPSVVLEIKSILNEYGIPKTAQFNGILRSISLVYHKGIHLLLSEASAEYTCTKYDDYDVLLCMSCGPDHSLQKLFVNISRSLLMILPSSY